MVIDSKQNQISEPNSNHVYNHKNQDNDSNHPKNNIVAKK